MASILDNAVLVGEESNYGTFVPPSRGFEAKADTFKRTQEYLDSSGIRYGRQAQRADRSRPVNMGGEGSIEADVLTNGFGILFQAMLGTTDGPSDGEVVFATAADDPQVSYTIQVLRTDVNGTQRVFSHLGSVVTGWSLAQEVGGLLTATFNFDFQDVVTDKPAGTPTYPADAQPFDWTQTSAEWDGSPLEIRSFSLDADLSMDVERRLLRGSALKRRPIRSGVPTFEGQMEMEFEDLDAYEAFVSGAVKPLTITWTYDQDHEVVLEMPAVQFTGESPEVSVDSLPVQNLPFKVLHGAEDAITLTYRTTDTSL